MHQISHPLLTSKHAPAILLLLAVNKQTRLQSVKVSFPFFLLLSIKMVGKKVFFFYPKDKRGKSKSDRVHLLPLRSSIRAVRCYICSWWIIQMRSAQRAREEGARDQFNQLLLRLFCSVCKHSARSNKMARTGRQQQLLLSLRLPLVAALLSLWREEEETNSEQIQLRSKSLPLVFSRVEPFRRCLVRLFFLQLEHNANESWWNYTARRRSGRSSEQTFFFSPFFLYIQIFSFE